MQNASQQNFHRQTGLFDDLDVLVSEATGMPIEIVQALLGWPEILTDDQVVEILMGYEVRACA